MAAHHSSLSLNNHTLGRMVLCDTKMCLSFSLEPTELAALLTTHNVSEETCERLQRETILTLSDLKQMTDMDISRLDLTLGEQIRLRGAIRKLSKKEQGSQVSDITGSLELDTAV